MFKYVQLVAGASLTAARELVAGSCGTAINTEGGRHRMYTKPPYNKPARKVGSNPSVKSSFVVFDFRAFLLQYCLTIFI